MGELVAEQWPLLIAGVLAGTFNMYQIQARRGKYSMGSLVWRFGPLLELVSWMLLLGVTAYLSYSYTWWLLLSLWAFPAVGAVLASGLRGWTAIVCLVGMPVFVIVSVVRLMM